MAAEVAKADQAKAAPTKPERPSEEEFKAKLANAEKELKAVEERMVSHWTAYAWYAFPSTAMRITDKAGLHSAASEGEDCAFGTIESEDIMLI